VNYIFVQIEKKKEQTKKHGIAYKIKQKDITYTLLKKKYTTEISESQFTEKYSTTIIIIIIILKTLFSKILEKNI